MLTSAAYKHEAQAAMKTYNSQAKKGKKYAKVYYCCYNSYHNGSYR